MDRKPGIDQLLIRAALDGELLRRLRESPEHVFRDFDLSVEEAEILRRPDHRLLPLLGAALARQKPPTEMRTPEIPAPQVPTAQSLPDFSLALTIVPCARHENGEFKGFQYATWVSPLPAGADPASLPLPAGAVLPGTPCAPLYAVISVSAVQLQDTAGNPQAGLWASLRQCSNVSAPAPEEAAGNPDAPPFGSDLNTPAVRDAVATVRNAPEAERYDRILSLIRVLRTGEVI
jgi:hypothetical protein